MVPAKLTNWLLEFHLCWVFCMFSPSTHSKIGHAAKVGQNHLQRLAQFSQSSFDKKKCVLSSQPNQEIWDVNLRYKKINNPAFWPSNEDGSTRPVPQSLPCSTPPAFFWGRLASTTKNSQLVKSSWSCKLLCGIHHRIFLPLTHQWITFK